MDSLFVKLKDAREAKHLTLADISEATLINEKLLKAIEEGNTSVLPQTYVRAFIREYASVVGLDPHEMMVMYDDSLKPTAADLEQSPRKEEQHAQASAKPSGKTSRLSSRMRKTLTVALVLLICAIGVWNLTHKEPPATTEEISFQSVVKENEQRANPTTAQGTPSSPPQAAPMETDSLTLGATTSDSVWVYLAIDDKPGRDYLFRQNAAVSWRARERFTVSLGNAGVIEFTLNGQRLGTLGKRGAVLRGISLTRQSIPHH
jgi:cytoskeletal protein RodZ